MTINRRATATFFAALSVAMLYPYAIGRAELPQDRTAQEAAQIPFRDPAHSYFFKYQTYLIQQGKTGETLETWNALPGLERVQKVSIGESLLKQIYSELSAKSVLSPKEAQLFQTVWGQAETQASQISIHENDLPRERSVAIEAVRGLSKNLEGFKALSNWGMLFDGDSSKPKGKSDFPIVSAMPAPGSAPAFQARRNLGRIIATRGSSDFAPSSQSHNVAEHSSSSDGRRDVAAFVIGATMLGAVCLGAMMLDGKRKLVAPKSGNFPAIDSLQSTVMRELDAKSAAGYSYEVQPAGAAVACDGCSGNCSGGCWGGCKGQCGGCTGDCSAACGGDCSVGCSGGCFGNCKGGCALNQSSSSAGSGLQGDGRGLTAAKEGCDACTGNCAGGCTGGCAVGSTNASSGSTKGNESPTVNGPEIAQNLRQELLSRGYPL